jgi:serine/threonine-protein kinase RsbW
MSAIRYNYTYKSVPEAEDWMYDDIREFMRKMKIEGRLANNLLLGVSEAFTNALLHGNKLDSSKKIELNIAINNGIITADISDEGTGDPEEIRHREDPKLLQERGRGVILMKTVSDKVVFRRDRARGGLRVTLKYDLKNYAARNKRITIE